MSFDINQKESKKSLLEKIQSLDHHTKTKLWIILSIVAIGFVVYIWGAYFNFIIAQVSQPSPTTDQTQEVGFLDKIKTGGAYAFQLLFSAIKYVGDILSAPREYIIK